MEVVKLRSTFVLAILCTYCSRSRLEVHGRLFGIHCNLERSLMGCWPVGLVANAVFIRHSAGVERNNGCYVEDTIVHREVAQSVDVKQ